MLGQLLKRIAPRIGARVVLEPTWRIVGQITFKSGKRSYFRYNTLDLNPVGSADLAKDKDYSNFFMKAMNYPIIPNSKAFLSKTWGARIGEKNLGIDEAYKYARSIGFPIVVKPNSGSQGSGVAIVYNKKEFYKSMKAIFAWDKLALVQSPVKGKDYRIVVLDNEIISAYERIPLNVHGDGISSVARLLRAKQENFLKIGRDTRVDTKDPRILAKLRRRGLSFRSVPRKGEQIFLLDNANLSTGGDSVDVTESIHPKFKEVAVKLTRDMGLRLCGVDLITEGKIENWPCQYWIIEINAAPGLDHYAKIGKSQEKTVEALYLNVLKHLEQ